MSFGMTREKRCKLLAMCYLKLRINYKDSRAAKCTQQTNKLLTENNKIMHTTQTAQAQK